VRIVIAGGTGFIGQSLVRSLAERGDEVIVLTRSASSSGGSGEGKGTPVEHRQWTPEAAGAWSSVVDGADAIINLAGAGVYDARWSPERKAVLRSSRIRSTELLASAIASASKRPRVFVSGSAIGYYGTATGDRVLGEGDPPGDDFLARLVVDWEGAAAAAREATGVRVVHPRIGLVLGRGGGVLGTMMPAFKAFVGGPLGSGEQYMAWIHLADTVGALLHMLDTPLEGPVNVTAPEPMTMNELTAALASAMGRPNLFRVPRFALELALGESAAAILTGPRAVPSKLSASGFAFVFPDLRSALDDLVKSS